MMGTLAGSETSSNVVMTFRGSSLNALSLAFSGFRSWPRSLDTALQHLLKLERNPYNDACCNAIQVLSGATTPTWHQGMLHKGFRAEVPESYRQSQWRTVLAASPSARKARHLVWRRTCSCQKLSLRRKGCSQLPRFGKEYIGFRARRQSPHTGSQIARKLVPGVRSRLRILGLGFNA